MARPTSTFRCTECGWTTAKWVGQCGECQQWNTVVEAAPATTSSRAVIPIRISESRAAKPITEIGSAEDVSHWPSGIAEFDRVLGGGIVPGAAILLSGEPGVGKSTLLLEVASRAAARGMRVLYVSAEESVNQVRMRAVRTNALQPTLYLAAEVDLAIILGQIEQVDPQLVIVDSVQTVASSASDGLAGGPSQVREVASTLIRVAKDRNVPVLLVGHVTKDGSIAGPRLLEHLVDVVLQFEGDRQTALRFVRSQKNRFGPTDEVGCFEMTGDGIAEVADPSGLFLSRTKQPVSGTCVTIAVEGRRALPVEIQALIVPSSAPMPRRVVNGVDSSRVAMLLAVLERRSKMALRQLGCLRLDRRRHPCHRARRRPRDRAGHRQCGPRSGATHDPRGDRRDQPRRRDPAGRLVKTAHLGGPAPGLHHDRGCAVRAVVPGIAGRVPTGGANQHATGRGTTRRGRAELLAQLQRRDDVFGQGLHRGRSCDIEPNRLEHAEVLGQEVQQGRRVVRRRKRFVLIRHHRRVGLGRREHQQHVLVGVITTKHPNLWVAIRREHRHDDIRVPKSERDLNRVARLEGGGE